MHSRRLSAAITAFVGVGLLVWVHTIPWAAYIEPIPPDAQPLNATEEPATSEATLYGVSTTQDNETSSQRWWSERLDRSDGIGALRFAIPIVAMAILVGLTAGISMLRRPGPLGPTISLAAGLVTAFAVLSYASGLKQFAKADIALQSGFWVAIFASLDLALAGIMGFIAYFQALRFAKFEMDRSPLRDRRDEGRLR